MLTLKNSGDDTNKSQFMITLDKAQTLNGYNNVIGELIEGEKVLSVIEASATRHGHFADEIKIERCGTK